MKKTLDQIVEEMAQTQVKAIVQSRVDARVKELLGSPTTGKPPKKYSVRWGANVRLMVNPLWKGDIASGTQLETLYLRLCELLPKGTAAKRSDITVALLAEKALGIISASDMSARLSYLLNKGALVAEAPAAPLQRDIGDAYAA